MEKTKKELVTIFEENPKLMEIQPFYHDLKNEIVEPEKIVVGTRYFWNKWAPILGPLRTVIIVKLRQHCYYNKLTKEKRDWCYPSQEKLAREIGVSKRTIKKLLNPSGKDKIIWEEFVRRVPQYIYDPKLRKKVRTVDKYFIAMDDPLVEEDKKLLAVKMAEKIIEQESAKNRKSQTIPDKKIGNDEESDLSAKFAPRCETSNDKEKKTFNKSSESDLSAKFAPEELPLGNSYNNVINVKNEEKNDIKNLERKPSYSYLLAKDITDILSDQKSLAWYIRIAKILMAENCEQLIFRCLGETKELAREGLVKKNKGALFTYLIKKYTSENGINLNANLTEINEIIKNKNQKEREKTWTTEEIKEMEPPQDYIKDISKFIPEISDKEMLKNLIKETVKEVLKEMPEKKDYEKTEEEVENVEKIESRRREKRDTVSEDHKKEIVRWYLDRRMSQKVFEIYKERYQIDDKLIAEVSKECKNNKNE